jgi:hypothetical protein
MNTFIYKNKEYNYFNHHHNNTYINERRVELSLMVEFMKNVKSFLEIGCVSPYYFDLNHPVYDLSDDHKRAINIDADNISLNDNILSISTLEHFGLGDYNNPKEKNKAINFFKKITSLGVKCLITWALGYNLELDDFIFKNFKNASFICRDNFEKQTWKQKTLEELNDVDKKYGTFSCANGICIIENIF